MLCRLVARAGRRYHPRVNSPNFGGAMTTEHDIEKLRSRHRHIEDVLHRETHRILPKEDTISGLKREKLHIKDRIFELERPR
jgi:hypothetical protein